MKNIIIGLLLVCFSLVSSLYLEKNFVNCLIAMIGAFFFIMGGIKMLDKFEKLDNHD